MNIGAFVLHWEDGDGEGIRKTRDCLASLQADVWNVDHVAITVIDNGSVKPWPKGFDSNVRVKRHEQNLHLIPAFNLAMQEREYDVYVCITNDTRAASGMIRNLVYWLQRPRIGVVAPGTNDKGAGALFTGEGPDFDKPFVYLPHVDNTVWAWTDEVVRKVGWPDATGHTHRANWACNRDFCYRARMSGFVVGAARNAYVWHAHMGGEDAVADAAGREWLLQRWGEELFPEVWS